MKSSNKYSVDVMIQYRDNDVMGNKCVMEINFKSLDKSIFEKLIPYLDFQ